MDSKKIAPKELNARLGKGERIALIDVRGPDEFAGGHVPGAVNIPVPTVLSRLSEIPEEGVVLICKGGARAAAVCEQLRSARPQAVVLDGGTMAWGAQGLPLEGARKDVSVERQVRSTVGIMILLGLVLAWQFGPGWLVLPAIAGVGLLSAGVTGYCPLSTAIAALPWNRPTAPTQVQEVAR